jgi:colanic acid/amylovoran biosynthesis glycosyltransferase
MKVLYIVSLFPCWSETFIVREIRELLAHGVDIRILSLKPPQEELVQEDARELLPRVIYPPRGWELIRAAVSGLWRRFGHNLGFILLIFRELWRSPISLAKTLVVWWRTLGAVEAVRAWGPDRVHAHWATYPASSAMHLSRLVGVPFSFTAHAHDIFVERQLLVPKLETAEFVATISEFNRRLLAQTAERAPAGRIRIVHCGIDVNNFPYMEGRPDPAAILAVGRLDEIKGFPVLIEACKLLRDQGVQYRCAIIGDGELRTVLESAIRMYQLHNNVQLLGARPQAEVRRYLYSAGMFVLPSVVTSNGNMDGIPVALMEAMAAGTPVISTRVSGIPELVEDRLSGLLVPQKDPVRLAGAIEELIALAGPARLEMTRAARSAIEDRFSVQRESAKLRGFFEGTVGDAP